MIVIEFLLILTFIGIVSTFIFTTVLNIKNGLEAHGQSMVVLTAFLMAILYPFYCIYTRDYVTAFQSFVVSTATAIAFYYTIRACVKIERRFTEWYNGE